MGWEDQLRGALDGVDVGRDRFADPVAVDFIDAAGRPRTIHVVARAGEWDDHVHLMHGDDDAALGELVARLLTSSPATQAVVTTREYRVELAPYVPRGRTGLGTSSD